MRRFAFVVALLGLFLLITALDFMTLPLSNSSDLSNTIDNQKFLVSGRVVEESFASSFRVLLLDSDIQLRCELPCPSFLDKKIQAVVIWDKFVNVNNNDSVLDIMGISSA